MSNHRPTIKARPSTWHTDGPGRGEPVPGVLLRTGSRGGRMFVPYAEAHALADQLHDLAEQHEFNESTNTEKEN